VHLEQHQGKSSHVRYPRGCSNWAFLGVAEEVLLLLAVEPIGWVASGGQAARRLWGLWRPPGTAEEPRRAVSWTALARWSEAEGGRQGSVLGVCGGVRKMREGGSLSEHTDHMHFFHVTQ
jgi:hypothetical protein